MCCQYSLLRLGFIKVFTFRHHVVPHCTHSTSLLRNGAWACRFMAPICYNYLHVIRMQDYLASGQVFCLQVAALDRLWSWCCCSSENGDWTLWAPLLDPARACAGLASCFSDRLLCKPPLHMPVFMYTPDYLLVNQHVSLWLHMCCCILVSSAGCRLDSSCLWCVQV